MRARRIARKGAAGASEAVDLFIGVVLSQGPAYEYLDVLRATGAGRKAFLRLLREKNIDDGIRQGFRQSWSSTFKIRRVVNDDAVLRKVLRRMLPEYRGEGMALYRGETAENRKRRTYGFSWSRDMGIARMFASGLNCLNPGGGVLLEAYVPPEGILAAPRESAGVKEEVEYLVDRRFLQRVKVLERFPG